MNDYERHARYKALAALGFKCSNCLSPRDLHLIHKDGRVAHRALIRRIDLLACIATSAEIRGLYKLLCTKCKNQSTNSSLEG